MCGICLADELQPVNPLPPVNRNFGGHCSMSGVIFPPALKTLLSIGGWNESSQMASSSSSRSTFVQSVVQYLRKYGFDGLDVDWECPTMRGGRPEDKRNFVLLLQVSCLRSPSD
ncbi:chitinase 5 [Caerostris darwini]|uniref:Chitinase 5 n=1 Tax=Caerostris darwini TaxID=1538125 RepID=A0AAV4Q773_9ARAC|nr:chitinase 5 [Caerostris darwini]